MFLSGANIKTLSENTYKLRFWFPKPEVAGSNPAECIQKYVLAIAQFDVSFLACAPPIPIQTEIELTEALNSHIEMSLRAKFELKKTKSPGTPGWEKCSSDMSGQRLK